MHWPGIGTLMRTSMMTVIAVIASPGVRAASVEKLLMPGPVSRAHEKQEQDCANCHDRSNRRSQSELCMDCHKVTRIDRPAIQKLTRIANSGEPLPWQRVHTLPDHVFFDHRPHVNAGITCQSCHGEVQTMKVLTREMGMRMGNCLGCHRDPHAALPPGSKITRGAEYCAACHR